MSVKEVLIVGWALFFLVIVVLKAKIFVAFMPLILFLCLLILTICTFEQFFSSAKKKGSRK